MYFLALPIVQPFLLAAKMCSYIALFAQFQSFTQYRCKLNTRTETEKVILRENPRVWNVVIVLNILQLLIDTSKINVLVRKRNKRMPSLVNLHREQERGVAGVEMVTLGTLSCISYAPHVS